MQIQKSCEQFLRVSSVALLVGLAGCGGGGGSDTASSSSAGSTPTTTRSTGWLGPDLEGSASKAPSSANPAVFDALYGGAIAADPGLEGRSIAGAPSTHTIEFAPPVQNQNNSAMGPAWAVSVQITTLANKLKYATDTSQGHDANTNAQSANIASARYLYTAQADSAAPNKASCSGATLAALYETVVRNQGVGSQASTPNFDSTQSAASLRCDASLLQQNPGWSADKANFTIDGYRTVALTLDAIKQELLLNNAVVFGAKVGNAFFQYSSGVYGVTQASSADAASNSTWHAMNIVGYDDEKQAFKVQNSWGAGWGQGGYAWVSYALMLDTQRWIAPNSLYVVYKSNGPIGVVESDLVDLMLAQNLSTVYLNPSNVLQISKTPVTGYLAIGSDGTDLTPPDLSQSPYTLLEVYAAALYALNH